MPSASWGHQAGRRSSGWHMLGSTHTAEHGQPQAHMVPAAAQSLQPDQLFLALHFHTRLIHLTDPSFPSCPCNMPNHPYPPNSPPQPQPTFLFMQPNIVNHTGTAVVTLMTLLNKMMTLLSKMMTLLSKSKPPAKRKCKKELRAAHLQP